MTAGSVPSATFDGKRLLRWIRRLLTGSAALLVLLLALGAVYQRIGQSADARRFPQQGRSVALGPAFAGVSLNINCTGQGSPVVVLETGAGVPAVGWSLVQPGIAGFTRVCSYDRAGYGWSTSGPLPRTSLEIARELHALLGAAGEKPPFILVAHSLGGFHARVYNHEYPAEVAGMVLVDASHEDQMNRMPAAMRAVMTSQGRMMSLYQKAAPALIRFGIVRALNQLRTRPPWISQELADETSYLSAQPKFIDAMISEAGVMTTESADEARASGDLGDKPLIVLTAGKMDMPPVLPQGVTREDILQFQSTWINDLQLREAHLSTRGRRIMVPDSDHMIPFERPDAVVSAVRDVFDTLTAPSVPSGRLSN